MNLVAARRALIVDDEDDMRTLLRVLLSDGTGDFEVVGEAADGRAAVEAWRRDDPDVVILDQRMPFLTGLEAAAVILSEAPDQEIILFSAFLSDEMRTEAAKLGVRACITKEQVFDLPELIRTTP